MQTNEVGRIKKILDDYAKTKSRITYLAGEVTVIREEIESATDISSRPLGGGSVVYHELERTERKTNRIITLKQSLRDTKKELTELQRAADRIERGVNCLDQRQREVLEKKFIEGKTWKEVADELNITERTCYRIYKRAIKQLVDTMAL